MNRAIKLKIMLLTDAELALRLRSMARTEEVGSVALWTSEERALTLQEAVRRILDYRTLIDEYVPKEES